MNIPFVSFKNLLRKPARTALLAAIVALASGTLFSASLVLLSAANALSTGADRLGADILVVPADAETTMRAALLSGEPTHFLMENAVLERTRSIEGVDRASPQLFIRPAPFSCCYDVDIFLVALDPATDFTIRPWIEHGLKRPLETGEIITGSALPVLAGDIIPFFGTAFRVAGSLEPTGMDFFDRAGFMSMESAYRMAEHSRSNAQQTISIPRGRISAVLVKLQDGVPPDRAAARIERASPGVHALVADTVIATVRRQIAGLERTAAFMGAMIWIIVLLIMGFAFSLIAAERSREIGLLRAMGARRSHVMLILLGEAGMISAAGGTAGVLVGLAGIAAFRDLLTHALGLPFLLPSPAQLLALMLTAAAAALVTGPAAALGTARKVLNRWPYEAIRREE